MSGPEAIIVSSLIGAAGSLFGGPVAPTPQAPPAAPAVAPAPEAPTVSTAPEVSGQEPVIDTEAARVRGIKRRQAAKGKQLFSLTQEDSDAVVQTKSLLGE